MKTISLLNSRRSFLKMGTVAVATLAAGTLNAQEAKSKPQEFKRPPAIESDLINQIVRFSHGNIEKVQSLLEEESNLVNGTWDWGGGDFETALGAASHMGRKDIANLLIDAGARKDMFYFAMEGDIKVIRAVISGDQDVVHVGGPHGLTLLYHAAISGNVDLTKYLQSVGALVDNGTLNAAVQYSKSYDMTEWVLNNGATYHGQTGFGKKPLADQARTNGLVKIAKLLDSRIVSKSP